MYRIPEEIKQFIRDNAAGTFNKDLAAMLNEKFGTNYSGMQLGSIKYRLGVVSGIDSTFRKGRRSSPATEFKAGHVPVNKGTKGMFPTAGGATRFKKGHRPHNWRPVGSERCNSDGYWEIKVEEPNKWRAKHVLIWEAENGPVPKGNVIIFLDGNKNNLKLENLAMISKAENVRKNQMHLYGGTTEIGRIAVDAAKLITKLHKLKSERSKRKCQN